MTNILYAADIDSKSMTNEYCEPMFDMFSMSGIIPEKEWEEKEDFMIFNLKDKNGQTVKYITGDVIELTPTYFQDMFVPVGSSIYPYSKIVIDARKLVINMPLRFDSKTNVELFAEEMIFDSNGIIVIASAPNNQAVKKISLTAKTIDFSKAKKIPLQFITQNWSSPTDGKKRELHLSVEELKGEFEKQVEPGDQDEGFKYFLRDHSLDKLFNMAGSPSRHSNYITASGAKALELYNQKLIAAHWPDMTVKKLTRMLTLDAYNSKNKKFIDKKIKRYSAQFASRNSLYASSKLMEIKLHLEQNTDYFGLGMADVPMISIEKLQENMNMQIDALFGKDNTHGGLLKLWDEDLKKLNDQKQKYLLRESNTKKFEGDINSLEEKQKELVKEIDQDFKTLDALRGQFENKSNSTKDLKNFLIIEHHRKIEAIKKNKQMVQALQVGVGVAGLCLGGIPPTLMTGASVFEAGAKYDTEKLMGRNPNGIEVMGTFSTAMSNYKAMDANIKGMRSSWDNSKKSFEGAKKAVEKQAKDVKAAINGGINRIKQFKPSNDKSLDNFILSVGSFERNASQLYTSANGFSTSDNATMSSWETDEYKKQITAVNKLSAEFDQQHNAIENKQREYAKAAMRIISTKALISELYTIDTESATETIRLGLLAQAVKDELLYDLRKTVVMLARAYMYKNGKLLIKNEGTSYDLMREIVKDPLSSKMIFGIKQDEFVKKIDEEHTRLLKVFKTFKVDVIKTLASDYAAEGPSTPVYIQKSASLDDCIITEYDVDSNHSVGLKKKVSRCEFMNTLNYQLKSMIKESHPNSDFITLPFNVIDENNLNKGQYLIDAFVNEINLSSPFGEGVVTLTLIHPRIGTIEVNNQCYYVQDYYLSENETIKYSIQYGAKSNVDGKVITYHNPNKFFIQKGELQYKMSGYERDDFRFPLHSYYLLHLHIPTDKLREWREQSPNIKVTKMSFVFYKSTGQ